MSRTDRDPFAPASPLPAAAGANARARAHASDPGTRRRRTLAVLVLIAALGGDAWQSLLGWPAFVVLVAALAAACLVSLVRGRSTRTLPLARYSKPLAAFLVLCTVSLLWSHYPGATLLGVLSQWLTAIAGFFIAVSLSWLEILRVLGTALRWLLGLSLLFEFVVAVFVRHPVGALWLLAPGQKPPPDYQWSEGNLFNGGALQGIVGNRNLLAFLVLLALIVFVIELVERTRRPLPSILWIGVALLEHALTRSATVLLATIGVGFVLAVALVIRRVPVNKRLVVYPFGIVGLLGITIFTLNLSDQLFPLLHRGDNLTGRIEIWNTVLNLAWQHPVLGWGWVSYWAPWAEPFKNLIVIDGTVYLQAHNAWIDVFLQLGLVGLFVFSCLIAATIIRSWWMAVDRPGPVVGVETPYQAVALLPLLLLAALIIQSLTESRLIVEGNFLLLVLLASKVKLDPLPLGPPPRAVR
ncbi:O-antigen ligase family protein [Subtercola endophyticus]|uniref:O-antigen ligase family protein n=1 Tax=Subtercola endophyticus TaxID=2895559 RepID=UPI001E46DA0D|nr:O-antigen ligase family protein [Subtercola endophyticus]UFS57735.1 O-antigen ligase family protein [Subtercola endophyticus]